MLNGVSDSQYGLSSERRVLNNLRNNGNVTNYNDYYINLLKKANNGDKKAMSVIKEEDAERHKTITADTMLQLALQNIQNMDPLGDNQYDFASAMNDIGIAQQNEENSRIMRNLSSQMSKIYNSMCFVTLNKSVDLRTNHFVVEENNNIPKINISVDHNIENLNLDLYRKGKDGDFKLLKNINVSNILAGNNDISAQIRNIIDVIGEIPSGEYKIGVSNNNSQNYKADFMISQKITDVMEDKFITKGGIVRKFDEIF